MISQPILEAAVALAICWGWFDWAALTLIGFLCMLHPSEMVPLVRQDIVFPEDAMSLDPVAYVHIRSPKIQRFARRQHCRLEDSLTLRFLTSLYLQRRHLYVFGDRGSSSDCLAGSLEQNKDYGILSSRGCRAVAASETPCMVSESHQNFEFFVT